MLDPRQTVASLVLDHPECAPVLQRNRIDYCCHGDVSLESACAAKGLEPRAVLEALSSAIERAGARGPDPRELPTSALLEHIVAKHHVYLREVLPYAEALAAKVSRVHGERDPRLLELLVTVRELSATLLPHLDVEENTLFPAMIARGPDGALLARELHATLDEHLAVGGLLERIRNVTRDFETPSWACTSYRTLFATLEQLEGDVLEHVHLENHVLLPRFAPTSA